MLKYITLVIFFITGEAAYAQTNGIQQGYSEAAAEETVTNPEEPAMVFPLQDVPLPLERERRVITGQQWQNLTNDPAFSYNDPGKEEETSSDPGFLGAVFLAIAEFFASGAGMVLLWIVLGLALVYIIFRMVRMKGNLFFARKDKRMVPGANVYADEYVPDDWQKAIQEAADGADYRLAVRHSYRYLLQLLSERGKISYQTAKTNYQYAYELAGTGLHQPFLQMTRQYEYTWYGGFDLERQQFDHYYSLLKNIQSGLDHPANHK